MSSRGALAPLLRPSSPLYLAARVVGAGDAVHAAAVAAGRVVPRAVGEGAHQLLVLPSSSQNTTHTTQHNTAQHNTERRPPNDAPERTIPTIPTIRPQATIPTSGDHPDLRRPSRPQATVQRI